ncbi:hypothetical protein H4Q26_006244 [Puccinia striiformis f. sp. tritici PST-130]|nr:hypothetical protein Pst134EB_024939 [Puccinia striiformis f. sp. tritici]KAI9606707.1 hypothetical protein H4Q26_006244 [Puccinia striiformis f. sp. tritici PST-130]
MQSSIFFVLCTLLLIQSAYSVFVCTDPSKPFAKQGICLRKINFAQDPNNKDLPPLGNNDFLVIDATYLSPDHWTCANLQIAHAPVTGRYCCDFVPRRDPNPKPYTKQDIAHLCYTRG